MASASICCDAVSKRFGRTEAVAPFSATLAAGQTTALVGPSGCGKSTILRMIAGLEAPDTGTIRLGGESPKDLARRGALAMAFQDPSLLPWRTVRSNIALGAWLARRPAGNLDALISMVGLDGFADHRPAELSGGMRQRAAIARALISDPEVLLLDEPFGAVDMITRSRLNAELPPLWRARNATSVLVTHSVQEAVLIADRIIVLSPRPARIVADLPVDPACRDAGQDPGTPVFHDMTGKVLAALEGSM
ncbi:ABC transporter ATP-binding protein [Roseobacter sp.]|uniref:ABC transporter ATP-binding protein n=1 Tax=Roseobacter sp. TaxID=1907202 RepID=UPI0025D69D1C|nr:ABC transporter ATP-binding protein [Roseobacter sp.]